MKDFIFQNTDKIYFGKNHIENLPTELKKLGKKVLMVYGGGSIKKNGIYQRITKLLKDEKIEFCELSGVEPNPRHTTVNRGVEICLKENVDVVLAVGGGSTIDCAKGICAAVKREDKNVWNIVKEGRHVKEALPLIVILTNAATGSEMDIYAVISNMETNEKVGIRGNALIPKVAFENPEYSYSLSKYQTACGAFDIFNHVLDNFYFGGENNFQLILEFQEAVMRAVVKYAPIAMKEPENYEARANLMWASSMALNGILDAGTRYSCACHAMEHELSAYYDITHGHGLAILTPRWLKYVLTEENAGAIYRLGVKVFDVEENLQKMDGAKETIKAIEKFCFETLELKSTLKELGIDETHFEEMANHACGGNKLIGPKNLDYKDVINIYKMCL